MADVVFVGSTFEGASSSSMTLNNIATTGDFALAMFSYRGTYTMTAVPAGWTAVDPPTIDGGGANDPFLRSYERIITSTDTTAWTWQRSDGTGGHVAALMVFRDVQSTGPYSGGVETDVGTSTQHAVANTTVSNAGSAAVAVVAGMQASGTQNYGTTSAGWTEEIDAGYIAGTLRATMGVFYSTGLSTGTLTGISVDSTNSCSAVTGAIVIEPSGGSSNPAARYFHYTDQGIS